MNNDATLIHDGRLETGRVHLVLFDMQLDLLPMIVDAGSVLDNCCWLADFARRQKIDTTFVAHDKLGDIAPRLAALSPEARHLGTQRFSLCEARGFDTLETATTQTQWVLAGVETHVALLHSALALKARGEDVFVVEDATSARAAADRRLALRRLERYGIEIVTREMLFFEVLRDSEREDYMPMSLNFLDGRYLKSLSQF